MGEQAVKKCCKRIENNGREALERAQGLTEETEKAFKEEKLQYDMFCKEPSGIQFYKIEDTVLL